MPVTAYNHVPIPSFMYGTAWKKEATTRLVQSAVAAGFRAIDTANQLIHYQEALVGDALQALAKNGIRSEEHTSELQSREKLVCRLLLEKNNALHAPVSPHGCVL